jgi:mono/diheme cytochrome c family protein
MSTPSNSDPRIDQAAVTDESLLAVHEKALGKQPDEKAHYRLMPLTLLFVFSGLIFFGGTYLGRYSGHFNSKIFDENAPPPSAAKAEAVVQLSPEEVIALGKKQYNTLGACVTCHQPNGLGTPPGIPPLAGSEWVNGSEERLVRVILHGITGKITVKGTAYEGQMPAFGRGPAGSANWSDDRIAAVATYIRQEWGNQAPPVSTAKVTEIRSKEGAHAQWTAEQLLALP